MPDKRKQIQEMFSEIAPRYDFLNRLLSFGTDQKWRRIAVEKAEIPHGGKLLDIAAGTGDVAFMALKVYKGEMTATGIDFSQPMIDIARAKALKLGFSKKASFINASAESIPFESSSFNATTIAFGIRNVVDMPRALKEMHRVLKPSGRCVILEFSNPEGSFFGAIYRFYFLKLLPFIGGVFSKKDAYRYLPDSVFEFPAPEEFSSLMKQAGFKKVDIYNLTFGIAKVYVGVK